MLRFVSTPFKKKAPPGVDAHPPGPLRAKLRAHTLTGETEYPFGPFQKVATKADWTQMEGKQDFTEEHLEEIKKQLTLKKAGSQNYMKRIQLEQETFEALKKDGTGELTVVTGGTVITSAFDLNVYGEVCRLSKNGNAPPILGISQDPDVSHEKLFDYGHSIIGHNMRQDAFRGRFLGKIANIDWERHGEPWWVHNRKHKWKKASRKPAQEAAPAVPPVQDIPSDTDSVTADEKHTVRATHTQADKQSVAFPVTPGVVQAPSFDSSDGEVVPTPPGVDRGEYYKSQSRSHKKLAKSETKRANMAQSDMSSLVQSQRDLTKSNCTLADNNKKLVDEQIKQNKTTTKALEDKHKIEMELKEKEARETALKDKAEIDKLRAALAAEKAQKGTDTQTVDSSKVRKKNPVDKTGIKSATLDGTPKVRTANLIANTDNTATGVAKPKADKTIRSCSRYNAKALDKVETAWPIGSVGELGGKEFEVVDFGTKNGLLCVSWSGGLYTIESLASLPGITGRYNGKTFTVEDYDEESDGVKISFDDSSTKTVSLEVLKFPVGTKVKHNKVSGFVVTSQTMKMVVLDNGKRTYPKNLECDD